MIRLIVAGSRGWTDIKLVFDSLDRLLSKANLEEVTIISGHCQNSKAAQEKGIIDSPDIMGEVYAEKRGLDLEIYPANWRPYSNKLGRTHYVKSAGYERNAKMAKLGTHLAAFWDGNSSGTKHMIDLAKSHGLAIAIIYKDGKIEKL